MFHAILYFVLSFLYWIKYGLCFTSHEQEKYIATNVQVIYS